MFSIFTDPDQSSHSVAVTFAILGWLVAVGEGVAIILYKFRRKLREIFGGGVG